jgi:hypothetical protein
MASNMAIGQAAVITHCPFGDAIVVVGSHFTRAAICEKLLTIAFLPLPFSFHSFLSQFQDKFYKNLLLPPYLYPQKMCYFFKDRKVQWRKIARFLLHFYFSCGASDVPKKGEL